MKRVSKHLLAVAILLLLGEAVCGANLIAFDGGAVLKVMDESGANVQDVHSGDYPNNPSISPLGFNGTWVAFTQVDQDIGSSMGLHIVSTDGGEPIKVLCSRGNDSRGDEYWGVSDPQWSPDGTEILVRLIYPNLEAEAYALLPSEFAVPPGATGADCAAPALERFDYFDTNGELDLGLTAGWNGDGSEIAFFERNLEDEWRLTILRREGGDWSWNRDFDIFSLPGEFPLDLDWQRDGDRLAFMVGEPAGRRTKWWLLWIDSLSGDWDFFEVDGNRVEGRSPSWSPDNSELVFSTQKERVYKWDLATGAVTQLTAGSYPDWQRDAVVGFCGDELCAGSETQCSCREDCGDPPLDEADSCTDFIDNDCDGAVDCEDVDCSDDPVCQEPYCGDGFCDVDEDQCTCPADCGTPLAFEGGHCSDGLDNDCDLNIDCDDTDCAEDTSCIGGFPGDPCTTGADCLSGLCHPRKLECK